MKKTTKDDFRVVAVIRPMKTKMSIASLGFKDIWGEPLEGQVWGDPFEITVHPRRLGDLGAGMSVGDRMVSRNIEADYQKRCEVIRDGMLQHANVVEARVEWHEEHTCSHCGSSWEELLTTDLPEMGQEDGRSIAGEPVCCTAAINEFRAGRGIAQCST